MTIKIGINGMGRIGRMVVRSIVESKNNKLKIKINGKYQVIKRKTSLKVLLSAFKLPLNKVAIELNQKIIDKKKLSKIELKNKDKIEIVHFIGGG